MRFVAMVRATQESESEEGPAGPDREIVEAMGAYNEELVKAGVMLVGEGLKPSREGARIHFSGSKRTVTDGPFAETKELIAGFWILQAKSLEEAIEWIKKAPNPFHEDSDIEIRPVYELDDFGDAMTPEMREHEEHLRAEIGQQHHAAG